MRSSFVRDATEVDVPFVAAFPAARWGPDVVSRGRVHRLASLPALRAEQVGAFAGCVTCRRDGARSLEIVTVDAVNPRQGVGTALLQAVRLKAERVWLVTTNDNRSAQAFYARVGMKPTAVHRGAVAESRRLEPSIPRVGANGVPIEDELVYEWSAENAT